MIQQGGACDVLIMYKGEACLLFLMYFLNIIESKAGHQRLNLKLCEQGFGNLMLAFFLLAGHH